MRLARVRGEVEDVTGEDGGPADRTPGHEPPVAPGDVLLDRYRIEALIAEGGQSLVYRVEDLRLQRPACVKIFHAPDLEPHMQAVVEESFVAEAGLLARLQHPSALEIYDLGYVRSPDGLERPFHVSELIGGGALSRLVKRRGPLSAGACLDVILPVCGVLAELHACGIVHLDVKPQNILLRAMKDGRHPTLADFGIAQPIGFAATGDESSVLMFSVNWAAPEQMVGDTVGPTSDVYSLALVTIFALTGRLVFDGTDGADGYRLRRHAEDLVEGAFAGSALPTDVQALLLRACRFHPEERVPTVLEFGRLLREGLDQVEGVTPPGALAATDSTPLRAFPGATSEGTLPGRVAAANLWPVSPDKFPPQIAGRHLRWEPLRPTAEVQADPNIRLRISVLLAAGDRPKLHIQGLSCFVSISGRRPSGALTLDGPAVVDFHSGRGESLGHARSALGAPGPGRTVLSLGDHLLVLPSDRCAVAAMLDFGPGKEAIIAYQGRGHNAL